MLDSLWSCSKMLGDVGQFVVVFKYVRCDVQMFGVMLDSLWSC